ncbi:MAG: glycosyl hydrolase family 18 protein [Gammaproteobacteria bacterium]
MGSRNIVRTALLGLAVTFGCLSAAAAPPQYTITTAVEGDGVVTLDPDQASYKKNNMVTVTAVPAGNWRFDHWEGDLSGDANPETLRVSSDHAVTAVFLEGSVEPPEPPPGVDRPPLPASQMVVGYFAQWTIYRRDYLPADIVASNSAEDLDVVNYAFAGIDENLRCVSLDPFADYGQRYDADESVDGVADTVSQPLKGNFNQFRKLKAMYPHVRVLLSIGGWTESYRFSDAALPENREAFVASCIDRFISGEVEPGISVAGVFDGLDIDWEYPGSCGETCDYRPEDRENFPALLAEFRGQLEAAEDQVEAATGSRPEYLLTIAGPAGAARYEPIDLGTAAGYLDWINIMAYDFHGAWESSGPANHHAALFSSPCDGQDGDWGDKAVGAYLSAGVPANKLLLGVPFYGRGWRGVSAVNDGLCQPARGIPRGTYEKGVDDYKVLEGAGDPPFWDDLTATHWTFDGSEFWSYDDARSLGVKAGYVNDTGLRGVMFWELSGDSPDGGLLDALRDSLGRPGQ